MEDADVGFESRRMRSDDGAESAILLSRGGKSLIRRRRVTARAVRLAAEANRLGDGSIDTLKRCGTRRVAGGRTDGRTDGRAPSVSFTRPAGRRPAPRR